MDQPAIRILAVDDEKLCVRVRGLSSWSRSAGGRRAGDGKEAARKPDAETLPDVRFYGYPHARNGTAWKPPAASAALAIAGDVLTTFDDDEFVFEGLGWSAGVYAKDVSGSESADAIRRWPKAVR